MKSIKLFVACVLSLVLVFIIMLIIGSKEAYAVTQYAQRCASNQDFVTSLYNSILKRSPDSEGYRNWVDFLSKGANREDVISKFFESQEYQGFGRSNRDYARDLYNGILGRDPDSGGHDYWTHALDTGMSKAEVMRRFFESPEYKRIIEQCNKRKMMPIIGSKEVHAVNQYAHRCASNQDFVTSLYNSILKRSPDSEGYRNWVDFLSKGAKREDVISKFFESSEYQGFGRSNRDYARDLYNGILGRDPDSGGHDNWTHALDTGMSKSEVMRRFFESPEYKGIIEQCNKLR